jgi:hypothetical protein
MCPCAIAGRQTSSSNALDFGTSYSESSAGLVKTTTYPNNGTRIETYAPDGSLLRVTGTATRPVRYTHWVEADGSLNARVSQQIALDANGADTQEQVKTAAPRVRRFPRCRRRASQFGAVQTATPGALCSIFRRQNRLSS